MNKATAHPESLSVEMPVSELPAGLARHARHMLGENARVQVTVTDARTNAEKLTALRHLIAAGIEETKRGDVKQFNIEDIIARAEKKYIR
jgi:hypothetical protein